METEPIIEFLLRNAQLATERMDRADVRMDRAEERMDRFERQLRILTRLGRRAFATLAEQNRETNARLDAVILLLERHLGGNGTAPA